MFDAFQEHLDSLPDDPSTYDRDEARMGAAWVRADGRPCPCVGSGWLITMSDAVVRCSCGAPAGLHPHDDYDPDEAAADASTEARHAEVVAAMALPVDDLPF